MSEITNTQPAPLYIDENIVATADDKSINAEDYIRQLEITIGRLERNSSSNNNGNEIKVLRELLDWLISRQ
jgi:hypothetical protein